MLPVEWTDVVIEDVPIGSAAAVECLAIGRFAGFVQKRGSRVTRSAANGPRRMMQAYSHIS